MNDRIPSKPRAPAFAPAVANGSRLQVVLDRLAKRSELKKNAHSAGSATQPERASKEIPTGESRATETLDVFASTSDAGASTKIIDAGNVSSTASRTGPGGTSGGMLGGGVLGARLAAMSGDLAATALVVHGDVVIESREDVARLRGVGTIIGRLTIADSALTSVDLEALSSLVEVGGLSLEGNRALKDLSAFANLKRIDEALYVGFNPELTSMQLENLQSVDGAMIVEGQPKLVEVSLPALSVVETYVHICENESLLRVDLGRLSELTEFALTDNPVLKDVAVAMTKAPGDLDTAGSLAVELPF